MASFVAHGHARRNHRSLGNRRTDPGEDIGRTAGKIQCLERPGGVLRFYHRKAT